MSIYWAKYEDHLGDTFRLDTRIYLHDTDHASDTDTCIGAVVGKNPGSAKPSFKSNDIQPVDLDGDKLLPTVRNVVLKSYKEAGIEPPKNTYIQVLNLFYLCNPNLGKAIEAMKISSGPRSCESERKNIPWVWYVWGGRHDLLNMFKVRYSSLKTKNHFFYDNVAGEVVSRPARELDFARHTQGLKHAFVIPYIAKLVVNSK